MFKNHKDLSGHKLNDVGKTENKNILGANEAFTGSLKLLHLYQRWQGAILMLSN